MSEIQPVNYSRPLIEEAVFDLKIRGSNFFTEELFKKFLDRNKDYTFQGKVQNINIDTQTGSHPSIDIIGYKCVSKDQKHIVQFSKYGFSFSRLKPYNGWDTNYATALTLWDSYCEIMNPKIIIRTATRFINQFRISEVFNSPKEYFNIYTQYNENIAPTWNQMSNRLLLSHKNGIKSHIIFDNNVDQNGQCVNVVFDIDTFSDNLTLSSADKGDLKSIFNQIRGVKNSIFENSITDKIKELIK